MREPSPAIIEARKEFAGIVAQVEAENPDWTPEKVARAAIMEYETRHNLRPRANMRHLRARQQ